MIEAQLKAQYQDFLYDFPYNSAVPVLAVAGIATDILLGDNCIGQAREFLKRFPCLRFSYIKDGRHHSLLARWKNCYYYINPYFLHKEPVFFSFGYSLEFQVPCHPCSTQFPKQWHSSLSIRKIFDELNVTRRRYSIRKGNFSLSSFIYELPLISSECPEKNDKGIAFASEQTTLSIRILERGTNDVLHFVTPIRLLSLKKRVQKQDFYVLDSYGAQYYYGERKFWDITFRISRQVRISPKELINFFELATDSYRKLAPDDLTYFSRNATNT